MRDLTADEREIVAGGWAFDEYRGDDWGVEVFVTARRGDWRSGTWWSYLRRPTPPPPSDDSGGGGSDPSSEEDSPETPRDTPCVTDKPTKHGNILDIHQAAIELKKDMPPPPHSLSGESHEYFGFIIKMPGGGVQTTQPVTSNSPKFVLAEDVWKAIDDIPDGAIILGMWHSQPDSPTMSSYDWAAHKMIFNNPDSPSMIARKDSVSITESLGRGITADPNGLSYVYDMKTGKIHVYDKSDMDSDKVQCHVNN